jgi:hypothetical protein
LDSHESCARPEDLLINRMSHLEFTSPELNLRACVLIFWLAGCGKRVLDGQKRPITTRARTWSQQLAGLGKSIVTPEKGLSAISWISGVGPAPDLWFGGQPFSCNRRIRRVADCKSKSIGQLNDRFLGQLLNLSGEVLGTACDLQ